MDQRQAVRKVEQFAQAVRQHLPVCDVLPYGSYAKGRPRQYSDIDVMQFMQVPTVPASSRDTLDPLGPVGPRALTRTLCYPLPDRLIHLWRLPCPT